MATKTVKNIAVTEKDADDTQESTSKGSLAAVVKKLVKKVSKPIWTLKQDIKSLQRLPTRNVVGVVGRVVAIVPTVMRM